MPRILIIEDNEDLAAGLRHNLELEGHEVEVALTGEAGLDSVEGGAPDLVVLDLMLPGKDGFQVLRELRDGHPRMPVLILTARGEEADRVRGFRLDADHYVTKPFGLLELLERVASLLRRYEATTEAAEAGREGPIAFGDVVVDPAARTVHRNGEPVSLSPKAFDLMLALIRRGGAVASRAELLKEVWGHRHVVFTRTVDSHISELRKGLEEDPREPEHFLTVWKAGYRFQG